MSYNDMAALSSWDSVPSAVSQAHPQGGATMLLPPHISPVILYSMVVAALVAFVLVAAVRYRQTRHLPHARLFWPLYLAEIAVFVIAMLSVMVTADRLPPWIQAVRRILMDSILVIPVLIALTIGFLYPSQPRSSGRNRP